MLLALFRQLIKIPKEPFHRIQWIQIQWICWLRSVLLHVQLSNSVCVISFPFTGSGSPGTGGVHASAFIYYC